SCCNAEKSSLQDKLKCCREELLCQSKMLCECEEALKRCQMEVREKCEEIRTLNCTIEELTCKLHERIARIADLDDCLSRCQGNLNEKCNELCEAEQKTVRVCNELQAVQCKLQEVEEAKDCLCKAVADQKAENAELAQELRITRFVV
ncbi:coiled-coil domain-containing protein 18, partial [Elysia marginata]